MRAINARACHVASGLRPIARLRRVYTALPFPTHCRVSSDMATRVPLLLAFAILTCFPQAFAALPKNVDAKTAKLLSTKYAATPIFACCQPSSRCLLACVYSLLSGKAPEGWFRTTRRASGAGRDLRCARLACNTVPTMP